jgi:hypothetical protein
MESHVPSPHPHALIHGHYPDALPGPPSCSRLAPALAPHPLPLTGRFC